MRKEYLDRAASYGSDDGNRQGLRRRTGNDRQTNTYYLSHGFCDGWWDLRVMADTAVKQVLLDW